MAKITEYSGVSRSQAGWVAKCSRYKDANGKKRKKRLGTFLNETEAGD